MIKKILIMKNNLVLQLQHENCKKNKKRFYFKKNKDFFFSLFLSLTEKKFYPDLYDRKNKIR